MPSPDWRDQIIYFALTDRFDDGKPSNNDQGAGEFKLGDRTRYQGGDLEGLRRRLAYIQGLGATALWITPPVANQWLDPSASYSGYHGYWAHHFKQMDPHVGTLAEYQALSRALHGRGMYLVQDIVVNHTGNYFSYRDRWRAGDPAHGWEAHTQSPPVAKPTQWPFSMNNPTVPRERLAGVYHWTPDINNYADPAQEHGFQMSALDDLNTESPLVRRALRDSYGYWIRHVGVDAFRVDTAFYVPPTYFADFMYSRDPKAPGMAHVAGATGRSRFHAFGEGFAVDKPYEDKQWAKILSYQRSASGQALLPGMLNFPLYAAFGDVFARGRPTAELGHRIKALADPSARAHWMPTFLDNHDVDRFLKSGTPAALKQALMAQFTLPGIPVVYYGTEQAFEEPRASMFAAGWGSGGRDHFDGQHELYRTIAQLAQLRRSSPTLRRGWPTVVAQSEAGAGVVGWRMSGNAAMGAAWLVLANTAGHESLAAVATGLAPGTRLLGRWGTDGLPQALTVGAGGRISLAMPARAGWVWQAGPAPQAAPVSNWHGPGPTLAWQDGHSARFRQLTGADPSAQRVSGHAKPGARVQVVIDGNLASATTAVPDGNGHWQSRLNLAAMSDPKAVHEVHAVVDGQASQPLQFKLKHEWQLLTQALDPAGDDQGPGTAGHGPYQYPTDSGWRNSRTMDILALRAYTSGTASTAGLAGTVAQAGPLRLEIDMAALSSAWNPPNGFDRVAFTVFIELPGREGGATAMPLQNAQLPGGMRWHLRLRTHGWSNGLFSAVGAGPQNEGQPVSPSFTVQVNAQNKTIALTLPASALGGAALSGARIYVSTWDYDAGFRALAPQAGPFTFGGGQERDPKIMDSVGPITLP